VKRLKTFTILAICLLLISAGCVTPSPTPEAPTPPQTPAPEEIPTAPTPTPTPAPAPTAPTDTGELKIHFIDVGQGDAILIDFGETEILIDGGDKSSGIVSYLNDYVDGCLEVIVATHPHADHIGGLISVLGSFEVEEIWHNGDSTTSKTYSEFTAAVQSEGADIHVGKRGDVINVGTLQFTILNPATLNGTTNNNSLVLSLSYGNIDFLFTGDAEKEAEADMLVSSVVPVLDVEILKVGHHGSNTACSNEFIAAAKPEIAVYMAGEDNRYGHPHEGTIRVLCDVGAQIYGTDIHGSIVITSDGEDYEIQLEKPAPSVKLATEG